MTYKDMLTSQYACDGGIFLRPGVTVNDAIVRLREYEATGLAPEEIRALRREAEPPEKDANGLLPCPFCGGGAKTRDFHEPYPNGWIGCQVCHCLLIG